MEAQSYIKAFNLEIKRQKAVNPNNETIAAIESIIESRKAYRSPRFNDFYSAMDDIGSKVGISILCNSVVNFEKHVVEGYIPAIKYHPANKLEFEPGEEELTGKIKSINKCYTILAKEQLYRFMRVRDFEKFIA